MSEEKVRFVPALVEAEITRLGVHDYGYGDVAVIVEGSPDFPDPEVGDQLYLLDGVVIPVKESGMQVGDRAVIGVIPNKNPDAPQRFVGIFLQREELEEPATATPATRRLAIEVEAPTELLRDASRWLADALAEFGEKFPEATANLRILPA
ncbi:MAG: hypothetical protein CEN89_40 [Candidatus Berkelbacteria bacterium Licking1014_7]|uniref:Uncharacterized protein n=1 Tax=Candidatus Berkelbacteria bacterium Licking1014_7 TaxID=2017147 RepID=A0A554LKW1_9BACT|nr:MAG: hypothetical protein CEN89_40 [Candidatus Berkelbacteria bacterium Licking1014_7]